MEFNKTIDNKILFTKPNGDVIIDLTHQTYKPKDLSVYDFIVATKDYEMRPDLIAQYVYKNVNLTDVILKTNGISNPFSIKEGDVFLVYNITDINQSFANTAINVTSELIRDQYIDKKDRKFGVDKNLKTFENRNKSKKADPTKTGPALPPNVANFGDAEIKIQGNKIVFGGDIAETDCDCDAVNIKNKTISKSEFNSKLIKAKLKSKFNENKSK